MAGAIVVVLESQEKATSQGTTWVPFKEYPLAVCSLNIRPKGPLQPVCSSYIHGGTNLRYSGTPSSVSTCSSGHQMNVFSEKNICNYVYIIYIYICVSWICFIQIYPLRTEEHQDFCQVASRLRASRGEMCGSILALLSGYR